MYSAGVEHDLRQRLRIARLDYDAINIVVKAGNRLDVPRALGDKWSAGWDVQVLQRLVSLSLPDRQHVLARQVDDFLQDPVNRLQRATHAATQTADPDLRIPGELALELQDVLEAFGRDVKVAAKSPFTGKVRYVTLTDLDVVTTKAIIEVTTQHDASGKVTQLVVLKGPVANPTGLPVFHYMPNLDPASSSAQTLRAAGSAEVYNDKAALVVAIRSLP
jgi:hypothetical protein